MARPAIPTTAAECAIGARLAYDNARRLVDVAKLLEDEGRFGPSVSLYATAAEEGAKALALWLASTSSDAALSSTYRDLLRKVMSEHQTKHAVATVASAATSLWFWAVVVLIGLLKREALEAMPRSVVDHPELIAAGWFALAPRLRQTGLYVDFLDGRWMTPLAVSATDAADARVAVESFIQAIARPFTHGPDAAVTP